MSLLFLDRPHKDRNPNHKNMPPFVSARRGVSQSPQGINVSWDFQHHTWLQSVTYDVHYIATKSWTYRSEDRNKITPFLKMGITGRTPVRIQGYNKPLVLSRACPFSSLCEVSSHCILFRKWWVCMNTVIFFTNEDATMIQLPICQLRLLVA